MNFCKKYQIDEGHQLLVQIITPPDSPPHSAIRYTTAIYGVTVSWYYTYEDEDTLNRVFDAFNDDEAISMYETLRDKYHRYMDDTQE